MASVTFWLAITAPKGAYPLERHFADTRMSGATSQCSTAKLRPVRPMPVITSSAISSTPWRPQISAIQVSRRRDHGAQSSAAHRLKDESGCLILCLLDSSLEFRGILLAAIAASVGAV